MIREGLIFIVILLIVLGVYSYVVLFPSFIDFTDTGFTLDTLCAKNMGLSVRPPHNSGSDVICWTYIDNVPEYRWSYNSIRGFLVNDKAQLPLKLRSDGSFCMGSNLTDGTHVITSLKSNGLVTFTLDDGNLIGLGNDCLGGLFRKIAPNSASTFINFRPTKPFGSGTYGFMLYELYNKFK